LRNFFTNRVSRLCETKSPGQGLNVNSRVQVPCIFGTQCGLGRARDQSPEAMSFEQGMCKFDGGAMSLIFGYEHIVFDYIVFGTVEWHALRVTRNCGTVECSLRSR